MMYHYAGPAYQRRASTVQNSWGSSAAPTATATRAPASPDTELEEEPQRSRPEQREATQTTKRNGREERQFEGRFEVRSHTARRGDVGTEVRPRALEQRRDWSWEGWGYRSEREWLRVARNLEMVNWGAVGALLGTAAAAAPAFYFGFTTYPFVFAQPLGAALGGIIGNVIILWRWRRNRDGLDLV
ncbi:MAG: hypothetical protein HY683_07560 [Chloroflexi bacterium]|nr:hypothetical protein [Chloroflexota bacterium]